MADPNPAGPPAQFRDLLRAFVLDPTLLLGQLTSAERIAQLVAAEVGPAGEPIFTPSVTLAVFLGQVLAADHSCRAAVARLLAWRAARGLPPCSADTGGYCKARQRLPESVLPALVRDTADRLAGGAPDAWRFHGRRVLIVDGSTVTMPDTPANQAAYPQHELQKAGCGSPLARIVVLISLATGAVLDAAIGRWAGKQAGELSLFRGLHGRLRRGDIILADRYHCSYPDLALLAARGVDAVVRLHRSRTADFRRGRRLGRDDHLVEWARPARPAWMDAETYATIPATLTVRELRVRPTRRGFRTRSLVVVTTLLDAAAYPREDLAGLYRARWHAELDLRSIKSTLGMDVLRCKSPAMVRKEVWAHLLAYDLVRSAMAEAALRHDARPRELSFQGARQVLTAFRCELAGAEPSAAAALAGVALAAIAGERVGCRPDRYEPRAVKRRPKPYPRLQEPRRKARKRLARAA
jgi:Transposase DDE domain